MSDEIKVTVLPDGTLKIETDTVSAPNHANAEQFFKLLSELCGGQVRVEKKQAREQLHHQEHRHLGAGK